MALTRFQSTSSLQSVQEFSRAVHTSPFAVIPLANAVTIIAVATYLLCAAVAVVSADLLFAFFQTWVHGVSLQPLRPEGQMLRPDTFFIGLITFAAVSWLATAATARVYNALIRR
jgi:hypothetical protein